MPINNLIPCMVIHKTKMRIRAVIMLVGAKRLMVLDHTSNTQTQRILVLLHQPTRTLMDLVVQDHSINGRTQMTTQTMQMKMEVVDHMIKAQGEGEVTQTLSPLDLLLQGEGCHQCHRSVYSCGEQMICFK